MAAFYRATVTEFLAGDPARLMLDLTSGVAGMGFDLRADQHAAWLEQARILHVSLTDLAYQTPAVATWGLLLEYQIPGRPKRLDAVLLDGAGIIAIEFKIGASEFLAADKWQLREYCWNLRLLDPENRPPPQHVVIFDEAQRVWTAEKVKAGLGKRVQRGQLTDVQRETIFATPHSEPDFLLRVMERCPGWCVVVALVGGGQEIHNGEAGLGAWGYALAAAARRWTIWVSPEALHGGASVAGQTLFGDEDPPDLDVRTSAALHLSRKAQPAR